MRDAESKSTIAVCEDSDRFFLLTPGCTWWCWTAGVGGRDQRVGQVSDSLRPVVTRNEVLVCCNVPRTTYRMEHHDD
eukprot:921088-Rhodomonas_salina.3